MDAAFQREQVVSGVFNVVDRRRLGRGKRRRDRDRWRQNDLEGLDRPRRASL
jgi:hypothetical protein